MQLPRVPSARAAITLCLLVLAIGSSACADAGSDDGSVDGAVAGAVTADAATSPAGAEGGDAADEPEVASPDPTRQSGGQDPAAPTGARMELVVNGERPHDAESFTQGLEFDGERLYESRGLYGESAVTEIDPADGRVLQERELLPTFFGEGLTVIDDRIIQITWQESTALVYDADTLEQTGTLTYTGEGWGICDADGVIYMSNGTSTLTHRDPVTFLPLEEVTVTLDGAPVDRINELECAGGVVWANVWQTNTILAIDPATGRAVGTVDASAIAGSDGRWAEDPSAADVLNGIAWDPGRQTWLVTGKLWPVTYEVSFECTSECADDVALSLPYHSRPRVGAVGLRHQGASQQPATSG